jgi:branched-chain amino acid transport system substrate-binding protein
MIAATATNPKLTEQGFDKVFRVVNRDTEQARLAGNYLAEQWADARIAILHDGTVYGRDLAEETRRQLNPRGVKATQFGEIVPGQPEYAETVAALEAAGIDVLFYGGYTAEAALIARHAHERDYDLQLLGSDNLNSEYFLRVAGPAAEGVRFVSMADPRRNEAAAPVVAKFRAEGYEPEGFTLYGYAVVQVWAQAVEKADTFAADAVVEALRDNDFDTVLGRLGFDDKGDVTGVDSFIWYVWSESGYHPAESE